MTPAHRSRREVHAATLLLVAWIAIAAVAPAQTPQPSIGTKGFAHTKAFATVPGPDGGVPSEVEAGWSDGSVCWRSRCWPWA